MYNNDGYYITNHDRWDRYAGTKLYDRKKRKSYWLCFIPLAGIVLAHEEMKEMGLSIL